MIQGNCPACAFQGDIEAFFSDDEWKRLVAAVAELPPECGRALMRYLRLFKPAKTGLRAARAVKLSRELLALIQAGSVCADDRGGVRRPATPAHWADGMELMLDQRTGLSLPLANHNYLRKVVFDLADKQDAAAERQREAQARAGTHLSSASGKSEQRVSETPLQAQLAWIGRMVELGDMSPEQAEEERAKARAKYGDGRG